MGNSQASFDFSQVSFCTEVDSVREKIYNHYTGNNKSQHQIILSKAYYNYQVIGSHRFIELYLICNGCSFSAYVRMDKTTAGKNISLFNQSFNESGWWFWEYVPKKFYNF